MTVASEIERLQWAKSDIKTSIEGKWVTVPASAKLDTYSCYIDKIIAPDYSCWTLAYWLKATIDLQWYRNSWLWLQYSEVTESWAVAWLFTNVWYRWSDNWEYQNYYFISKNPWCDAQWSSAGSWCVSDNYSSCKNYVYAHNTNPDCFLINRAYYCRGTWSGSHWSDTYNYYRLWIDFSVPCMSCLWSGQRYECMNGSSYCSRDGTPPWDDYTYIGTDVWAIANCRWNRPAWILCTTIESSVDNHYIWAAVFR